MLSGVILLWFILTALSVAFVATDIHSTPESPVLKWGFVLVTAYTGPFGAFLYVLGCREPLPGIAYPMNWWLISHHLKHGMVTVRKPGAAQAAATEPAMDHKMMAMSETQPTKLSVGTIVGMGVLSPAMFAVGIAVAVISVRLSRT